MRFRLLSLSLALVFCVTPQWAQAPTWQNVQDLPAVDMSALTAAQKRAALTALREQGCPCGCGMKVAECRVKDPNCSYSRAVANLGVKEAASGKNAAQITAALAASSLTKPRAAPAILEDPITIPIANAPEKGPANAKITVVEFSDFQCPYCAQAIAQADALLKMYPNDVRLVFKQFPLDDHPQARMAAEAALAAHAQGKFWPMHDKLFANSRNLNRENVLVWAKELGLDMQKFTADLQSGKYRKTVEKDLADGANAGVMGTPSFYLNGRKYNGLFDTAAVKPLIDAELKK
jgi:protein-disulfide isomerase